jgi:TolB-like protein/Tfp pilus assembly protein PilF
VTGSPRVLPPVLSERYRIERLIGRGGMASVHLARDLRHDRLVAVKVLHADLAQSVSGERFLREISIAAKLTHPNILPLHDSGSAGDLLYYVMPFVEGETLRALLDRERQLTLEHALRIACEVASAIDYAHRQNVVHRDIKPENILLADGHAIVADFGIARAVATAADTKITITGLALGTPTYMSPEQASGESVLDGRSDIYALACVLYEMLAGQPPFTGPTAHSIIAKRMAGPPPGIRSVRSTIPVGVEQVLLRAMDPEPENRFASAHDFAEALAVCTRKSTRVPAWMTSGGLRVGAAAAGVLAAAIVAAAMLRNRPSSTSAITTIAVLPLANHSRDPDHAYLAEGLTNALIGDLMEMPGIRVVSRMSVMRFGSMGAMAMPSGGETAEAASAADAMAGPMSGGMAFMESPADPSANASGAMPAGDMGGRHSLTGIARKLRANVLLQGSLARTGDSVRVSAALIRAPSLEQIWHVSYSRHVRDLFELQRELATKVVAEITRGDVTGAVPKADTSREYDSEAHQAYLKGAYFLAHWKLQQAAESFDRAVRLDSTYAPAHASLARTYYFLAFFGDVPPSVALARMRQAASAGLQQDSTLAEAHGQLALVKMLQDWDWSGAEAQFRRALAISPGNAQIRHDYAHFLLGQGRQRESAEQTRQAVALDPVNPMLVSCLGWHSLFDARYDDAYRFATEANAMMPDQWAYVVLGWALLGRGRSDSALVAFREASRLDNRPFTLAALGYALAVTGHEKQARATLQTLLDRVDREYVSPYDIATVYAGLGDADNTFKWLQRAALERSMFIVHVGWDSRFDRVRADPRFADLTTEQLRLPKARFAVLTAAERRGM